MFGRNKKKKKHKPTLLFKYEDGSETSYDIYQIPLDDDEIIRGSILYFDDPEPCMIHKGAVMTRYYEEICQWALTVEPGRLYAIDDWPSQLIKYIDTATIDNATGFMIRQGK